MSFSTDACIALGTVSISSSRGAQQHPLLKPYDLWRVDSFGAFTFAFRGRAAGVALVDVRAARDGGEPVGRGRTDLVKKRFLCWGAVGHFAGVRVRSEKMQGGWFLGWFSVIVLRFRCWRLCPFGMLLVGRVYASKLFNLRVYHLDIPPRQTDAKSRSNHLRADPRPPQSPSRRTVCLILRLAANFRFVDLYFTSALRDGR